MEETARHNEAPSTSDATPYVQEFQNELEKELVVEGQDYENQKNGICVSFCVRWGRVPFQMKFDRILAVADEKDLNLHVTCNRGAIDPHWRIRFTVTVQYNFHQHEEWESVEQSMTANRKFNKLVLPVMRVLDDASGATVRVKIKINSSSGNFPPPLRSFTEKTDITDATLIVEGRRLYVSRSIMSIHSSYFHNLFYNRNFSDAVNHEFDLPDVSFDDMQTFLCLIYPIAINDHQKCITSIDTIEAMLTLAERFACDSVMRLMEVYLMGEENTEIEGFTFARRLLLADRFRLSAPCSRLMERLRSNDELRQLGETEEYNELSDAIRGAILDMRMEGMSSSLPRGPPARPEVGDRMITHTDCSRGAFLRAARQQPLRVQYLPRPQAPPAPQPPPPAPAVAAAPAAPAASAAASAAECVHRTLALLELPASAAAAGTGGFRTAGASSSAPAASAAPAAATAAERLRDVLALLGPAPAAPAAGAADSSRNASWAELHVDLGRLENAVQEWPMGSWQAGQLYEDIEYLRSFRLHEYNVRDAQAHLRDAMQATIRELIDPNSHHSQPTRDSMIARLISQVASIRFHRSLGTGPDRKRPRLS